MSILRIINSVGNYMPHAARRFVLDKLGVGGLMSKWTANSVETVRLENGLLLYLNPLLQGNIARPETHEPEIIEALKKNLRSGSVMYDIGANIGLQSLIASPIVGPSGRIFAFEPGHDNLRYLRKNIAENGLTNIEVQPFAIGGADGTMTFDERGSMSGRLADGTEDLVRPVAVEVRSIDSLVASGLPFPDIVKIDVEGGEGAVLEGAVETLARGTIVICEMHAWAADGVRRAEEALKKAVYTTTHLRERSPTGHDEGYHVLAKPSAAS